VLFAENQRGRRISDATETKRQSTALAISGWLLKASMHLRRTVVQNWRLGGSHRRVNHIQRLRESAICRLDTWRVHDILGLGRMERRVRVLPPGAGRRSMPRCARVRGFEWQIGNSPVC
jgi:hypothetical protein